MRKYYYSFLFLTTLLFGFNNYNKIVTVKQHLGMTLIGAKNKSFVMGWNVDEAGREWACFVGKHKVSFTYNFYMDTVLVTQQDYLKLMKENPSVHKTGNLNLPVERVSWYHAILYCNARSKRDKLDSVYSYKAIIRNGDTILNLTDFAFNIHKNGYRLPTNSEYEYAERADKTGTYFFSETSENLDVKAGDYAWSTNNSGGITHAVASKKPNPWGLYDLVGNLFEWCNDWEGPYPVTDQKDPVGPQDGKTECGNFFIGSEKKVAKGGSYKTDVQGHMRISYHFKWPPASLTGEIGFRCVATKLN
jgi:formylglycine-generating enzyme required for sulfatase activity